MWSLMLSDLFLDNNILRFKQIESLRSHAYELAVLVVRERLYIAQIIQQSRIYAVMEELCCTGKGSMGSAIIL